MRICHRPACLIISALLLLPILLTVSCENPARQAQQPDPATPAAKNPVVAALDHFRRSPDLFLPGSSDTKSVLLVDRRYETGEGFISESQLSSDTSSDHWTVPEDARRDMERRANANERFPTSGLPAFIHVVDFNSERGGDREMIQRYPDAKCTIGLWPPGYTRDRNQVVVRFSFGPTPHGATAVYLLERRDGLWHVIHHSVSYYA